jgi:hypothetical protein
VVFNLFVMRDCLFCFLGCSFFGDDKKVCHILMMIFQTRRKKSKNLGKTRNISTEKIFKSTKKILFLSFTDKNLGKNYIKYSSNPPNFKSPPNF